MGAPTADPFAEPDEKPQHRVRIGHAFYLGTHEVTVGQFRVFASETGYQTKAEKEGGGVFDAKRKKIVHDPNVDWRNPGLWRPQDDDEPVVQVCWNDAQAFCDWLSKREGVPYRLPYEAEWEYACRAGGEGLWSVGDDLDRLDDVAWVRSNAGFVTHPVGRKEANAFGLFDMHGNVWEWCKDRYAPTYPAESVDDPRGPSEGPDRVLRGGSWDHSELETTRSSVRLHHPSSFRYYTVGFRVRRSPAPPEAAPRSP
jgi:formylglycine-generating enzyme required for sulfatase activity